MTEYEKAVAAYRRHIEPGPLTQALKTRIVGAMARAGDLTTFGARVLFLKLENAMPDFAHFNAPPPWVFQDPHYISAQRLKRMVDAYNGNWGSAWVD